MDTPKRRNSIYQQMYNIRKSNSQQYLLLIALIRDSREFNFLNWFRYEFDIFNIPWRDNLLFLNNWEPYLRSQTDKVYKQGFLDDITYWCMRDIIDLLVYVRSRHRLFFTLYYLTHKKS